MIELLERPVAGGVTWYGGEGEYVDVAGVAGPSEFQARAVAGPTVRVREAVEGQGGVEEQRILCVTEFIFDVAVHFETADGALNEDWNGQGTYDVSGTLGATGLLQVMVQDPRPFAGTLEVTEHAEVVDDWKTRELLVMLNFATQPLDFVGMHGMIRYHLTNMGNAHGEGELVAVTIAEFAFPL